VKGALAMELIQNFAFNEQDDLLTLLTRYTVLWDSYGRAVARTRLRASPDELFLEATGVDRRDLFAVAFWLWTEAISWAPPGRYRFDLKSSLGMPPNVVDRCIGLFAVDLPAMSTALHAQSGDWQLLPFEESPALRFDDGSVVLLDESFLFERVTSGLYWYVLGHEQKRDERQASTWSTAYGAMIEAYAEDRILAMAPRPADFYSEEQIKNAYGGRQADAILDFGDLLFFEIQKGQISLPTRQQGLIEKFKQDTDRLVLDKAAQLEVAALKIFDNETPLTGRPPRAISKGWPVIVSGGGYPVNPLTFEYIAFVADQRNLLKDPRFDALCVIDLSELEMLEAVYERTRQPPSVVLTQWKSGGGRRYSLKNHFWHTRTALRDEYRPPWMIEAYRALSEDLETRLNVSSTK
jgi:hypothetical protein